MKYQRCATTAYVYGSEISLDNQEVLYVADIESSHIFTFNRVGLLIWELLETPMGGEELIHEMAEIYGVDRETVADSIFDFLATLERQGFIEQVD